MMAIKRVIVLALLLLPVLALTACERTITRIESSNQPLTCVQCHDESNLITGKKTEWAESVHGTGTAYLRGTSRSCAGCHSGNAFKERIAAGLDPDELTEGDPDPTRQDCRACHQIHSTYTMADFALMTTSPVQFYAGDLVGTSYNGGEGNLCVNCHQPRRTIPAPVGGIISGITTHWGPHHGPQSTMILGKGGAGVAGTPSGHYAVPNTCVHCHMGDERDHHFEPEVARCQGCHPGLTDFDYNGAQTEILTLADQLGQALFNAGLITENSPDGEPAVTSAPTAQAEALWNWLYVVHEDKSNGVHNRAYAKALLEYGLAQLPGPNPVMLRVDND